jgi:hypothetical protein
MDPKTDDNSPEVTFGTKAEYTEHLTGKIGEALKPKLKKLADAETQIETLTAKVIELEEAQTSQAQAQADQRQSAEMTKLQKQVEALTGQIGEKEAAADTYRKRWHESRVAETLQALAAPHAAKTALADIPRLFPRDAVQVTETDSGPRVTIVDPTTGIERDPAEAMKAWLDERPHLKAALPRGSGAPAAGPPGDKGDKDPLAGLAPGAEQLTAAFRNG